MPYRGRPLEDSGHPSESKSGAQAVERAMAVLDCFATDATHATHATHAAGATRGRRTLSEVAATTGLPLSTTHRIMSALTRGGFLERDGDDAYRIGAHLRDLVAGHTRLTEAAAPHLHALATGIKRTVSFGVADGGTLRVLHRARAASNHDDPGHTDLPLERSQMGRVLLAFHPSGLAVLRVLGPVSRRRLADDLERIRRRGFAFDEQTGELAVPVGATVAIAVLRATPQIIPPMQHFAGRIFHDVETELAANT